MFATGYKYAGVQNGYNCSCGDSYGKHGMALNEAEECNKRCHGEPPQICGGEHRNSVFATGVQSEFAAKRI